MKVNNARTDPTIHAPRGMSHSLDETDARLMHSWLHSTDSHMRTPNQNIANEYEKALTNQSNLQYVSAAAKMGEIAELELSHP